MPDDDITIPVDPNEPPDYENLIIPPWLLEDDGGDLNGGTTTPGPPPPTESTDTTPLNPPTPTETTDATAVGDTTSTTPTEEKTDTEKPTNKTEKVEETDTLSDNDASLYINEIYAKVPFRMQPQSFDNGQQIQFTIFFAPKYIFSNNGEGFNETDFTFIEYGKQVKRLAIEDKLSRFGISGYIDVDNTGEHLNTIFDRLNCYHLVINIRI